MRFLVNFLLYKIPDLYQRFTLFEGDIVAGGFWGTNTMLGSYGQPFRKAVYEAKPVQWSAIAMFRGSKINIFCEIFTYFGVHLSQS